MYHNLLSINKPAGYEYIIHIWSLNSQYRMLVRI